MNQLQTQNTEQQDLNLQRYIQHILESIQESLEKGELDSVQALASLIQVSDIQTKEALVLKIAELKSKYPCLEHIEIRDRSDQKAIFDDVVQKVMTALIKEGKTIEATDFVNQASTMQGSLDSLKSSFPQYLNLID
jgi:hypothetical protein